MRTMFPCSSKSAMRSIGAPSALTTPVWLMVTSAPGGTMIGRFDVPITWRPSATIAPSGVMLSLPSRV